MRHQGTLRHLYMTVGHLLGFKEPWSLALCTFACGYCHHFHPLISYSLRSYHSYHLWWSHRRARAGAINDAGSQVLQPTEALDTWFVIAFSELERPHSLYLVAGEWFWDRQTLYRSALVVHAWSCFCEWFLFTAMSECDTNAFLGCSS